MEIENSANKTFKREEVKQLLKPKNDIVFQTLFSKEHVNITKNFVQSLLDKKIKSIKINDDKELFRENISDKLGILDLQLDIDNKEKVDVEIQLVDKGNFIERLMFYFSRLYSNTIMKENKEIEEAIVTVHKMTEDEKLERLAWLREKAILDEKSIRSTYLKRGREEGIKEIVEKMKEEKIPIETIIKVTGLSKDEIEKL